MNKLVRDLVPEIIGKNGDEAEIRVVEDDAEFDRLLRKKLIEEVNEVNEADSRDHLLEELADLMTVKDALCRLHEITAEELTAQQQKKDTERGGFENRIFLISTKKK